MAYQQSMLSPEALRNFKEFLEIYNKTTETCFGHCVVNLNHRDVTKEEDKCLNDCTTKLTNLNHRLLSVFMVEQPIITQKKVEEAQKQAEEAMKLLEAQGISAENLSPEEMAAKLMDVMPGATGQHQGQK